MSSTGARDQAAAGQPAGAPRHLSPGGQPGGPARRRGRWLAAAVAVALVAAGLGAAAAAGAFGTNAPAGSGAASSGYETSTAVVRQESLTSQTQVDGTLGDSGSYTVVVPPGAGSSSSGPGASGSAGSGSAGSGSGTFTALPAVGDTVRQGQVICRISGSPTVLLYGDVPAYRDLEEGLTGADVTELNADLVKLGYASRAALGPRSGWDYYSAETAYAVERLQAGLGVTVSGILTLGQAAFLPGPALVTGLGTGTALGGPAAPGATVLTATSTTPVVTVPLDAGQQSEVRDGDKVSVTLPDGSTTPGVVTEVSTVASSSSSGGSSGSPGSGSPGSGGSGSGTPATIPVLVSLLHPRAAGTLNQAPVTVTITTGSVAGALVVPVDALLAEPGNKYAVEVISAGRHRLVTVLPGLFDDAAGLVQVSGGGLAAGQRVVVPGI